MIKNASFGNSLLRVAYQSPISFLSECKDVVVTCVIIEPTFNHEREGRGNFVQEGKSGGPRITALPLSLCKQRSDVGGCVSFSEATLKPDQTPTFIVQSISAA